MMKKKSRKGFTFVEVIITLVVLGALAGTFLINYRDSLITAKAVTIVTNLRTIKDAALAYRMSTPNPTIREFIEKGEAKKYLGDTVSTKLESTDLNTIPKEELESIIGTEIEHTYWSGGVVTIDGKVSYRIWSMTETKGGAELGIWKAQCNYGNQNNKDSNGNNLGGDPDMKAIRVKLIELAPEARLLSEGLKPYTASFDRQFVASKDANGTKYFRASNTIQYKVAVRIE